MPSNHAMITARALGAMPEFIEAECGSRALTQAFADANLPIEIIDRRELFIPETSLMAFIAAGGKLVGDERIGLSLAPVLTVAEYGIWGDYFLSAPRCARACNAPCRR